MFNISLYLSHVKCSLYGLVRKRCPKTGRSQQILGFFVIHLTIYHNQTIYQHVLEYLTTLQCFINVVLLLLLLLLLYLFYALGSKDPESYKHKAKIKR